MPDPHAHREWHVWHVWHVWSRCDLSVAGSAVMAKLRGRDATAGKRLFEMTGMAAQDWHSARRARCTIFGQSPRAPRRTHLENVPKLSPILSHAKSASSRCGNPDWTCGYKPQYGRRSGVGQDAQPVRHISQAKCAPKSGTTPATGGWKRVRRRTSAHGRLVRGFSLEEPDQRAFQGWTVGCSRPVDSCENDVGAILAACPDSGADSRPVAPWTTF